MRVMALVLFVLSGCATTAQFKRNCDSWVWKPEAQLVAAWGIPDGSYESDGVKYLKYKSHHTAVDTMHGYRGGPDLTTAIDYDCETVFVIKGGFVDSYSFKGNHCVAQ